MDDTDADLLLRLLHGCPMTNATAARPQHVESNSQLDGLVTRMQRFADQPNRAAFHPKTPAEEILVEALMTVAKNMPHTPRVAIARLLSAYEKM